MKRVLITGGTGFVGSNLARRLVLDGHKVHLIVRPEFTSWRIDEIRNDIILHIIDLCNKEGVKKLVLDLHPEWIFHLAAYGAYSRQTEMYDIVLTNFLGTVNLLTACLTCGFEAFVNTGSSSEYGFKNHAPAENEFLEPNSFYAVSKASSTLFCRYTAQQYNVNVPTLRLYSVYGPYEDPRRLIPQMVINGLHGKYPNLVNQDTARDFIFINDVIDVFLAAAMAQTSEYGEVYNVGSGKQTSLKQLVEIFKSLFEINDQPQWGSMNNRSWDTNVWVCDNKKMLIQWRICYLNSTIFFRI